MSRVVIPPAVRAARLSRQRGSVTAAALALVLAGAGGAQQPAPAGPTDTLRLDVSQRQALAADPRARELRLLASQSALRERNIAAERLPSLSGQAQAQYQSQVVSIPVNLPGFHFPIPPHDTYDSYVNAQESIFDPTAGPRRAQEHAQLAQSEAQVRSTINELRQDVTTAFFTAALLDARQAELAATIADLEAQLRQAADRVRQGTSLPSDTATLQATILQRQQDDAQLRGDRRAALSTLAELVGRPIADTVLLELPDVSATVAQARARLDTLRARPEYQQFARTRETLARQEDVAAAQTLPKLSAFGKVGYGRPGLNLLSNQFQGYWLTGLQLQWAPWTWGTVDRNREVLALQQQIVTDDEAAFTQGLRRSVESDLATMDRLQTTLAMDDRIIALRERVEREARLRVTEGVITAAEYLDRNTDLLSARLARAEHRVTLAQARAHFLTTLGVEVR